MGFFIEKVTIFDSIALSAIGAVCAGHFLAIRPALCLLIGIGIGIFVLLILLLSTSVGVLAIAFIIVLARHIRARDDDRYCFTPNV